MMNTSVYKGLLGETPYQVFILSPTHLNEMLALQQKVYEDLPDKSILQPLTEGEFLTILNGQGKMIGAYVDEKLIAFRALLQPETEDEEHLGYDIGLEKESQLKRVLYQEISNVDPDYRGFGLQKILANVIMSLIDQTKFDYVCATVAPYNIASLKDKFAQGMYIGALKYKYSGKLRYTFAICLHKQEGLEENSIFKSMSDTEEQQTLLEQGYIGVAMMNVDDDWFVEYKKKLHM